MSRKQYNTNNGYHREPTGRAAETAKAHPYTPPDAQDSGRPHGRRLVLFGSCFCPFVSRCWIALERLGIDYEYREVDPYAKPPELLQISPKGLVPALVIPPSSSRPHPSSLHESFPIILDYLSSLPIPSTSTPPLIPPAHIHPLRAARTRLVAHVSANEIVPAFYAYLQEQDTGSKREEKRKTLVKALEEFQGRLDRDVGEEGEDGPFWGGSDELGYVDVVLAPWAHRIVVVLSHYVSFSLPPSLENGRYKAWQDAVIAHPAVQATTSTEQLYIDSYARYAENRPNTSQVADATNQGKPLP